MVEGKGAISKADVLLYSVNTVLRLGLVNTKYPGQLLVNNPATTCLNLGFVHILSELLLNVDFHKWNVILGPS